MKKLQLIAFLLLTVAVFPLRAAKEFAHPDRIRYDGNCFQIEGRDVFVLSAALHC